jgi:colanic acid/amylovoran biosynthesis glycosyltransferase
MPAIESGRVGYVVKRYPRYSETFIVSEILAHEAAGLSIEIFSLRPATDGHFQDTIARVRAPVRYLPYSGLKAADFWASVEEASDLLPELWPALGTVRHENVHDVYQALLLAREARLRGVRHLHAHFASVATRVARLAALFAGITYSFTAHAKDIFHEDASHADLERCLADATAVVTVSDYNLRYLGESYGPAAARVRRIYNGLHLDRFPYEAPVERPARIVSVGRLIEKKGFGYLIDACALLAEQGRDFQCQIIGSGELEPEMRARINRQGLRDRVEMLGPRPQREVIALVQSAAVFAAPCVVGEDGNRDGLPTVLLEAMALGTPCVSTDVTGIPEVLRDGETGLMVPQHDPQAVARAIAWLLDDRELGIRLAGRARRLIEEEFDIDRNAACMRAVFRRAGDRPNVTRQSVRGGM